MTSASSLMYVVTAPSMGVESSDEMHRYDYYHLTPELLNFHVTAHRPWGSYTILDESEGYKVKRIVVKPGKRLSLQKHHHRSEHWIVVSGTAIVTKGKEEYSVRANESTYIPMGEIHRFENVGKIDLVMIEAQVGEYVGEDDIVRIEDDFARK